MRKPSPISTISPRAMTISRPCGQRGRDEDQGGGAVVDHVAPPRRRGRRRAGRRSRRARAGRGRPVARSSSTSVVPAARSRRPTRGGATAGARPRLVCSSTPVALSTGRRLAAVSGQRVEDGVDDAPRARAPRAGRGACAAADGLLDQRAAQPAPAAARAGGRRARRRCAAPGAAGRTRRSPDERTARAGPGAGAGARGAARGGAGRRADRAKVALARFDLAKATFARYA